MLSRAPDAAPCAAVAAWCAADPGPWLHSASVGPGSAVHREGRCAASRTRCIGPSFRGLRVVRNGRTRADEIAVAVDVVDATDRRPVFVRARGAGGEAAFGAGIG